MRTDMGFIPNIPIYSALEDNNTTMAVLLDLSKAFDNIDQGILLNKIAHYGVRGKFSE